MKASDQHDLIQGSLIRSIWHLAWPSTVSLMLFMLPGLYAAVWLGHLGTNLVSLWIVQVLPAYLLSRAAGLEAGGIWLALTLGWILQAALMGLRFWQGSWKSKQV